MSEVLLDCPIVIGQYDNMPESATLNPPIGTQVLDELVPPPGPLWRRAALWLVVLGMMGAIAWAATTGTVIPQVSADVVAWGGTGPVGVTAELTNNSRVDLEVVDGPRPRPGLSPIGFTIDAVSTPGFAALSEPAENPTEVFPLRLAPGERVHLTAWYRVSDCLAIEGIDHDDDRIELRVRIADGPASWFTSERTIDAQHLEPDDSDPTSWPAGLARRACAG